MQLYHRTTAERAQSILREGFKDAEGFYLTAQLSSGVWVSEVPLDSNEGAKGDTLLSVRLNLPEAAIADYEWVEEEKPYREWLVPAALLNKHCEVQVANEESIESRFFSS